MIAGCAIIIFPTYYFNYGYPYCFLFSNFTENTAIKIQVHIYSYGPLNIVGVQWSSIEFYMFKEYLIILKNDKLLSDKCIYPKSIESINIFLHTHMGVHTYVYMYAYMQ